MTELKLHQPAPRISLAAILIALLLLGTVIGFVVYYYPHETATIEILRTATHPTHVVFASPTHIVGGDKTEDNLYVLARVRITDHLNLPLFLSDFTATLTTTEGDEITSSAIQKQDFATLATAFPDLKPKFAEPHLLRESTIEPKQSAEGLIVFRFPITEEVWKKRKSATFKVAFYHQEPMSIDFPADGGA